jgi:hypothetical protein
MPYYFYIIIGFLAIAVFFVMLWKTRSRKEVMRREDEWMQSLLSEEWGLNEKEDDEE